MHPALRRPVRETEEHMPLLPGVVTVLFTDIEGSSQLWEREPERMRPALARHDDIARQAVEDHQGILAGTGFEPVTFGL